MEFIAQQGFINSSPRKVRAVVGQIKDLPLTQALAALSFWPKKVSLIVRGTLMSAMANAKVRGIKEEELKIQSIQVFARPSLERVKPRARGQADRIQRRKACLKVVLSKKGDQN